MIVKTLYQYGQMSFLCTVHRNLCIVHRILCTFHGQFRQILCKMWNFHLEPRTKILTHFKVSDGEIAFLKFHFLLEVIIHNFHIIITRRKWHYNKAISASEPLKCARILVLGSKWKFNVFQKNRQKCSVYSTQKSAYNAHVSVYRTQKTHLPILLVIGLNQAS